MSQAGLHAKKEKKGVYLTGNASSRAATRRCSCSGVQLVRLRDDLKHEVVGLKEGWISSSTLPAKLFSVLRDFCLLFFNKYSIVLSWVLGSVEGGM